MTLNAIAQTADAALCRSMGANAADEIPGEGPKWACECFGSYGHNAVTCITCTGNFMELNDIKGEVHEHTGSN
ncbi:MAG: hypothetical protein PHC49_10725 [Desulfuromonadaceae bacterium]|nr:hypothetical protein [Desulfuromonadaceae bacterium]